MTQPEHALGLFGGTFDPIHYGHLRLAETAREALGLERVRFIPAGRPPHRGTPGASGTDRLAMARLATADNPAFEVDPAEVDAAQASFTILTLERLRLALGPQRPLVLLLGVDAFLGLPGWKRWTELFDFATSRWPTGQATASMQRRCPLSWRPSPNSARPPRTPSKPVPTGLWCSSP